MAEEYPETGSGRAGPCLFSHGRALSANLRRHRVTGIRGQKAEHGAVAGFIAGSLTSLVVWLPLLWFLFWR